MSSRQEEKERRRAEREALEAKERAAAARGRRLQIAGGAVLVIALVAVALVLVLGGGGDDSTPTTANGPAAGIPAAGPNADDLGAAAKAAGCTVRTLPSEGRGHTEDAVKYKTNPPTSGPHNPVPAEDGIYDRGNTPETEAYVHTLEHGRILFQYRPGTDTRTTSQLETLLNEEVNGTEGYHSVLMENDTKMPFAVAATAWTQMIGCKTMNPKVFDAFRAFRTQYVDKAPELIP